MTPAGQPLDLWLAPTVTAGSSASITFLKVEQNTPPSNPKNTASMKKRLMTDFGLSKGGLCAVLNAQREYIDRRGAEPPAHVRVRVQTLEAFAASMDNGHARFLGKLAFGSLGHNDLAQAMTQETLNLTQLQALYDKYWLEFDGMFKRAKLRKA